MRSTAMAMGLKISPRSYQRSSFPEWENALAYGKDEETGKEIPVALDVQKASLMEQSNAYNGEKVYGCGHGEFALIRI